MLLSAEKVYGNVHFPFQQNFQGISQVFSDGITDGITVPDWWIRKCTKFINYLFRRCTFLYCNCFFPIDPGKYSNILRYSIKLEQNKKACNECKIEFHLVKLPLSRYNFFFRCTSLLECEACEQPLIKSADQCKRSMFSIQNSVSS